MRNTFSSGEYIKKMETVQRTLDILETFLKQSGEIGMAELSKMSGVNITTAYRITSDLVKRGYLRQKQKRGKYSIGIKLLEYGRIIQFNLKVGEIALPHLRQISQVSGEYSEIAIMDSDAAITIAQVEVNHNLKISNDIGERLPLHATSLGKLFLAFMEEENRKAFYENCILESFTDNTITDINRFEQELRLIKQQGFSIDNEEYDTGVWAIATPIFDARKSVVAALAIAAPSARIDTGKQQELTRLAQNGALNISRELGYRCGLK